MVLVMARRGDLININIHKYVNNLPIVFIIPKVSRFNTEKICFIINDLVFTYFRNLIYSAHGPGLRGPGVSCPRTDIRICD
jgi:hypothetical protein